MRDLVRWHTLDLLTIPDRHQLAGRGGGGDKVAHSRPALARERGSGDSRSGRGTGQVTHGMGVDDVAHGQWGGVGQVAYSRREVCGGAGQVVHHMNLPPPPLSTELHTRVKTLPSLRGRLQKKMAVPF